METAKKPGVGRISDLLRLPGSTLPTDPIRRLVEQTLEGLISDGVIESYHYFPHMSVSNKTHRTGYLRYSVSIIGGAYQVQVTVAISPDFVHFNRYSTSRNIHIDVNTDLAGKQAILLKDYIHRQFYGRYHGQAAEIFVSSILDNFNKYATKVEVTGVLVDAELDKRNTDFLVHYRRNDGLTYSSKLQIKSSVEAQGKFMEDNPNTKISSLWVKPRTLKAFMEKTMTSGQRLLVVEKLENLFYDLKEKGPKHEYL